MLPNTPLFPSFKKLTLEDMDTIRTLSQWHPPYSDANFVKLWSWDTEKQTTFSILDNVLIVQTCTPFQHNPYLVILGNNSFDTRFAHIYTFAQQNAISTIKYLAEPFLQHKYSLEEDRDDFDYLYDISDLATLEGINYHSKRSLSKRFAHERRPQIELLDLKNPDTQEEVSMLFHAWVNQKEYDSQEEYLPEFLAIENCFDLARHMNTLIGVGLYSFNRLVGFCLVEILPNQYALLHFEKTDLSSPGISEYLMQHTAQKLLEFGSKWLNYEQDLGMEGLRHAKMLWRPKTFLKKYTIPVKK